MSVGFVLHSRFPSFRPARFPLPEGTTLIGRSGACDFVIRNETVSRKHAEIRIEGAVATVRDLGSSNGTLLDGKRIDASSLKVGQHLQFGKVGFLIGMGLEYDFDTDSTVDNSGNAPPANVEPEAFGSRTTIPDAHLLSAAQQRVLDLLVEGRKEKDIARLLDLSRATVHNHTCAIYRAYKVHSRPELLALVLRRNEQEGKVNSRGRSIS